MWSGTQIQSRPHLPTIRKYSSPTHVSASARRDHFSSADDQVKVGGLGLAVLTAYKSKPDANPVTTTNQIQRRKSLRQLQEEEDELVVDGGELSGSDVLLALQKAATKKKKSSGGKKNMSNNCGTRLNESDDDQEESSGRVKPLMIKSEWGKRIDDLERRLQELSEI
ncbi:unnamed protein product [Rhodiola kirilowii]